MQRVALGRFSRDNRRSLVGIRALFAAGVDCGYHIIIGGPALNGRVVIGHADDQAGVDLGIARSTCCTAVDVIPGNR